MRSRMLVLASLIPLSSIVVGCVAPAADEDGDVDSAALEIRAGATAGAYPEAVLVDGQRNGSLGEPCSGVLVAPRVVLTAARCVSGYDGFRVRAPFAYGREAWGRWSEVYGSYYGGSAGADANDIALVFLDRPIWLNGYPQLASYPLMDGDRVVSVGRARDGEISSSSMYMSEPVSIVDATSHGYREHYASTAITEQGDDGGPVFAANTHVIVAVNAGMADGATLFARTDGVRNWIRQRAAEYGDGTNQGWPGGPGGPGPGWPGGPGGGPGWPGGPGGGHGDGDGHGHGHGDGDGHGWPGGPGNGPGNGGGHGDGHGNGGGQGNGGGHGDGHGNGPGNGGSNGWPPGGGNGGGNGWPPGGGNGGGNGWPPGGGNGGGHGDGNGNGGGQGNGGGHGNGGGDHHHH
ncbi:MAG: trypsin-like serine protease [Minicystis sp.]